MVIRELSRDECARVLAGHRLARLACAREAQPYVVPVYLAYRPASGCLYGFTTPGQKVEWMRANPLVCVEVDEVTAPDQWVSVVVFGRYEELPRNPQHEGVRPRALERSRQADPGGPAWPGDGPDRPSESGGGEDEDRERAWQVLKASPCWWEPGCAAWASRAHRGPAAPFVPVYYRIRVDRVTGYEAARDGGDAPHNAAPPAPAVRRGRLRRALKRVFGRE